MLHPPSYMNIPGLDLERCAPVPVRAPRLVFWNAGLAQEFGMPDAWQAQEDTLAEWFAGNALMEGIQPIALAYAGHQFGGLAPQLGDGRAHLLGELKHPGGEFWDVQLKGSGRTRYSRGGDGRCALGPAVREYLMSEALHALGVPTSRSLAVVATGETIVRERRLPGAVVTRLARSHLRVGTFEYYALRNQTKTLAALVDYTLDRLYPDVDIAEASMADKALRLFEAVQARQIRLVVHWLRIGFIHGVMNTDNTALSGDTIDFGPCAMLGTYHPETVFSSIDHHGRYAFGNQPKIAHWNLARFAETLLPLIDPEPDHAVSRIEPLLQAFPDQFHAAFHHMVKGKLGLIGDDPQDKTLISDLLHLMEDNAMDYTNTFVALMDALNEPEQAIRMEKALSPWYRRWQTRLSSQPGGIDQAAHRMAECNPRVIPRNHHVETVLAACANGDTQPAIDFLRVLRTPYEQGPETERYQDLPDDGDRYYRTFCGT